MAPAYLTFSVFRRILAITIVIGLFAEVFSACSGLSVLSASPLTIGMDTTAVNSLVFIAADQNFFVSSGLNLSVKEYPSGLAAVNGLLAGEVDLADASEFVLVGNAFSGQKITTIASIDKFRHNYLIGRKDHGIRAPADLKGKRIGLPLKTASEFYLGRFLELNGMNFHQVDYVNTGPPQLVDALVNGDVDAVVAWQPNAQTLTERLGDGIVRWPVQSEQATYCDVVAAQTWLSGHSDLVKKFLRSLSQAQDFLDRYPDQAKALLRKRFNYSDSYMAAIWPEHQFQLSQEQSMVLAMEDEARWMIANGLTDQKKIPDFLDFIYLDTLAEIRPEAVSIIH